MTYQMRVKGHLETEWAEWFDGLTIVNEPNGEATLTGPVRDQAALNGLLNKVFGLNLELISVMRVPSPTQETPFGRA
jgi:hypothetical protein